MFGKIVEPEADPEPEAEAESTEDTEKASEIVAKTEPKPKETPEEKQEEKAKEKRSEEPPAKPVMRVAARPEPQPKAHEPWKDKRNKKRSGLWRTIWIVTGILIVVLVVLIVVPVEKRNMAGKKDQPVQPVLTGQPADTPAASDQSDADEGEAGETGNSEQEQGPEQEAVTQAEPELETPAVESNYFFIIAGSFSHLGNASELQDKLKAKGYPAEVIFTENRMYRVCVDSYATRQEAESSLLRMQSEPGMESCWLLSNE